MNLDVNTTGLAPAQFEPRAGAAYGFAWKRWPKYFLELLLILVINFIFSIPMWFMENDNIQTSQDFFYLIIGIAYGILIFGPINYGVSYAFLKAARGEVLKVNHMFRGFNYFWNCVLANILENVIIIGGFVLFFVPGIIFAAKLAFVQYYVVDRKLEAIEAIKASWRDTKGYTPTLVGMIFLAVLIALLGFLLLGVGLIPAMMWISLAFAAFYNSTMRFINKTESPAGETE